MLAPRLSIEGYGGVLSDLSTVRSIWNTAASNYRRALKDVYSETFSVLSEYHQVSPDVLAGKLAMRRGRLAESRLIRRPDLRTTSRDFVKRHGVPDETGRLHDPLTDTTAHFVNDWCIAWESNLPASRIEESPLLEALFSSSEIRSFAKGFGAVHVNQGRVSWVTGDRGFLFDALEVSETVPAKSQDELPELALNA